MRERKVLVFPNLQTVQPTDGGNLARASKLQNDSRERGGQLLTYPPPRLPDFKRQMMRNLKYPSLLNAFDSCICLTLEMLTDISKKKRSARNLFEKAPIMQVDNVVLQDAEKIGLWNTTIDSHDYTQDS